MDPFSDTSIRYPVMAAPPSLGGALHARSIRVCPFPAAVNPSGAPGRLCGVDGAER